MDIADVEASFTDLEPDDDRSFAALANTTAQYQYDNNTVFRRFVDALGDDPVDCYLPATAFKQSILATFDQTNAEATFRSSGTGTTGRSTHYVRSLEVYRRSFRTWFDDCVAPRPGTILAHLPGYVTAGSESSLLFMVEDLIERFGDDYSAIFLDDVSQLENACQSGVPVLLFGAAFGLLDLGDSGVPGLPEGSLIIETGGMKTSRTEMHRDELHDALGTMFGIPRSAIWSEYGMCELLSQAYRGRDGHFQFPPWVRWKLFDPENPRKEQQRGLPGLLGICDLANMYSVSTILTEDMAIQKEGGFEIIGRLTGAELRGCNLLLEAYRDLS